MEANLLTMCRFTGYVIVIALLIASASCKKSSAGNQHPETTSDSLIAPLLGSWNWVLTVNNGFSSGNFTGDPFGDSTTPASTGITQTLTFNPDDSWFLVQNNSGLANGTFKITQVINPGGSLNEGPLLMLDLISAGGKDSIVNHCISHDTLVISDPLIVTVGRNWVYVRINGQPTSQPSASPQ
jgi:hypothetical protein